MIVVGVDPGLTGALAIISAGALLAVDDMPVAGGDISAQLLAVWAREWIEGCTTPELAAIVEDVHSMPKQGVASSFKFGRGKGVVEGVLAGAGWPLHYVSPAKWKRDMRLTKDKGACRQRACELWPSRADLFRRVKDDGRAEAALIAYWFTNHAPGGKPQ